MICLDNTDTLEGGASTASVVDYTVHGLVSNTFTVLADGQLSDTDPSVLYTAAAAISIVSITLVNTHSAAVTVNLYLDSANGGNPRHLIPEDVSLGVGSSLVFDGQRFTVMDTNGNIITSVNVNIATDSGSVTPASSFTIAGGEGIDTSASGTTVTVAGEIATDSNKGVASFSSDNFLVTAGAVTIKDSGVSLTAEVTGTLPVANGGTGASTLTDHGILVGSGTGAITPLAVGTTGQILIGATGADPVWSSEIVVTATESTFGGNIVIPASGYIGLMGDTDLMQLTANYLTLNGTLNVAVHNGSTVGLRLAGSLVTSTAAELNILDGKTFYDEDNMASNSATGIASQQSIKAYVDANSGGGGDTIAFSAYVNTSLLNKTGGGALYTVSFDTEIHDTGSDFSTTTFTAPEAGVYHFDVRVMFDGLASGNTKGQLRIETSNRIYMAVFGPWAIRDTTNNYASMSFSVDADMDASDTAYMSVKVIGTTNVVDLLGQADYAFTPTSFCGHLVK